ncbi:hypothetical protein ASO20_01480 [Mycoplasma sp. (ex Biomphalaria glabrata)]|nr:hypothetical protein ASO20_01480 [Mycoplasma sp. (ex Biomphalaria glabrata)]
MDKNPTIIIQGIAPNPPIIKAIPTPITFPNPKREAREEINTLIGETFFSKWFSVIENDLYIWRIFVNWKNLKVIVNNNDTPKIIPA